MKDQQPELPNVEIEQWLSPKQLAAHWGLKEDSAERWVSDGTVPQEYIRYCGRWRIRIHPSVIPVLEKVFIQAHHR